MNDARRKDIEKALDLIYEAKAILETVSEEEQEAFDNLPEGIQNSERGETMEENISILDDAVSALGDHYDYLLGL